MPSDPSASDEGEGNVDVAARCLGVAADRVRGIGKLLGGRAIKPFAEGIKLIDESIRRVEVNGDHCYMPELLRVKGRLLLSTSPGGGDDAEMCLMQSLELSRRQGARSWELRAATDLAVLLNARGRSGDARALLQPAFDQFMEGRETADLKAAQRLLATLG